MFENSFNQIHASTQVLALGDTEFDDGTILSNRPYASHTWSSAGDYPVVLGVLLIVSVAVVFFAIVTDVAYTFIDPRIRLQD